LGVAAFVNAGLELAHQVRAGKLPEPNSIFVPANTGSTVAGLAIGMHISGLQSRVIGIAVKPSWRVRKRKISHLINRSVAMLRSAGCRDITPPSATQYMVLGDFDGGGIHNTTAAAQQAVSLARDTERLHLEPHQSGKVLSAILDQALTWHEFRETTVLFWNTTSDR